MPKNSQNPENESKNEPLECNLEDGLQETLLRIEELLLDQNIVVITIHGSDINVGKSYLSDQLIMALKEKQIGVAWAGSEIERLGSFEIELPNDKGVIIFTADPIVGTPLRLNLKDQITKTWDTKIEEAGKKIGLPIKKIDIKIAIQTPEKPFEQQENWGPSADIIITNTGAQKKP